MRVVGLIVISIFLCSVATAAGEVCGPHTVDNRTCSDNSCCSYNGYCGNDADHCYRRNRCHSNCWPERTASTIPARYDSRLDSETQRYHYPYRYDRIFICSLGFKWVNITEYEKYQWSGLCDPSGPKDACGKCVNVTNTLSNKQTKVRIRDDNCHDGFEGMNLDGRSFEALGGSEARDKLAVKYQFVDCDD